MTTGHKGKFKINVKKCIIPVQAISCNGDILKATHGCKNCLWSESMSSPWDLVIFGSSRLLTKISVSPLPSNRELLYLLFATIFFILYHYICDKFDSSSEIIHFWYWNCHYHFKHNMTFLPKLFLFFFYTQVFFAQYSIVIFFSGGIICELALLTVPLLKVPHYTYTYIF